MTTHTFMCHSSVDASLAKAVIEALEADGVACWIAPRDVLTGENYPRQLVRAIQDCSTFLLLVTPASAQSDHVLRELEQAARHRRPVLPIIIDNASSGDLDYYLGALHRISGSADSIIEDVVRHFRRPNGASGGPLELDQLESAQDGDGDEAIRVGVIPWPPFASHGTNESPASGLYVELLDQYAVDTGIAVHYVDITNDVAMSSLRAGDVDVVACLYRTPRRERDFDFAACLFASTIGAVVRSDDDRINSHGDLMRSDVRLAVCRGEIGAELAVDTFGAARGSSRLVELDTTDVGNIGRLVAAGVADAAITDNITCQMIVNDLGPSVRHQFSTFPLYVGHIGLLMMKGREALRDHLTDRLRVLRSGESIAESQRQLHENYAGMLQIL